MESRVPAQGYEDRLRLVLGVPDAEHYKWHKLFGNDCRYPNCPLRREKEVAK